MSTEAGLVGGWVWMNVARIRRWPQNDMLMSRIEIDVQTDRPDCSGGVGLLCDSVWIAEAGDGV